MNLPILPLSIPVPELVPVLAHPVAVHFAVVLPLIILILELINLITKRKSLTITVYILFVMLVGFFLAAFVTGAADAKAGWQLLNGDAMAALKEHKKIAVYLIYLSALPILLKLLTLAVKKPWAKIVYLLSFVGIIALTMYQAKEGGELVYKHGVNVEAKVELDDKLEELQDEFDELEESYEEQIEALEKQISDMNVTATETNTTAVAVEKRVNTEAITEVVETNTTVLKVDVNSTKSSEVNSSK